MMTHDELVNRIVDDGIASVKKHFAHRETERRGSIAGFEDCRGKDINQLKQLLIEAKENREKAREAEGKDNKTYERYWYLRYYELQVEFVCNVVSVGLYNQGQTPIIPPTARGVRRAAEILGVKRIAEFAEFMTNMAKYKFYHDPK